MTRKRLNEILKKMERRKVVVIGDFILDKYVWGSVNRISPEAPIPVLEVKKETFSLGAGANVAANLKSLGVSPLCVSICGRDEEGEELKRQLNKKGISALSFVADPDRPTTVKTRVIAQRQQVVRIDKEKAMDISGDIEKKVLAAFDAAAKDAAAVVVSDYGKGAVTPGLVSRVSAVCRQKNVFTAVDPKERHFGYYRDVSIITPNQKEAEYGSGIKIVDDRTLQQAGEKLIRDLHLDACLITLGEQGMALFEKGKPIVKIPTTASVVYDVTGAGDTVISVFTAALAAGADLKEAALLSNYAAGLVVREIGTATVTPEQISAAVFG